MEQQLFREQSKQYGSMATKQDMHTEMKRKVEELESIFADFKEKLQALQFEQEKIVQEYIARVGEKKKETLLSKHTT